MTRKLRPTKPPPPMDTTLPTDTILTTYVTKDEGIYRFRRANMVHGVLIPSIKHVRVSGGALAMLDEADWHDGAKVLHALRELLVWQDNWYTLWVVLIRGSISHTTNKWFPPSISSTLIPDYGRFAGIRVSILDLEILHQFTDSVFRVRVPRGSRIQHAILKICPVAEQLEVFTKEIKIYNKLRKAKAFEIVPELYGYVYEGIEERIIGFICQEIEGSFAEKSHYKSIKTAVNELHRHGIVHGALKLPNLIVDNVSKRVYIFGFKQSILDDIDLNGYFETQTAKELLRLKRFF